MVKRGKSASKKPSASYENEMLRILLDISQSLYQYLNIDDVILHIIRLIKDLLNAEAVSVILQDEKKDEFVFRWAEDERSKAKSKLQELRFPIDQGIAGRVFSSGKPEIILDISKEQYHFKKVDAVTKSKTKSMVAVPLPKKKKIIGVLEALNKKRGVFDNSDLNLLSTIAPIMALALDNARMYAELESAFKLLKKEDRAKANIIKHTKAENIRLRQEIEERYRFDQIIGNSDSMLAIFRLCEKVMDSSITILIEGETGTGKELVARCIHFNSPRKDKPFVTQNCGGIPETLLASELFGHKRGAFTGAVSDKKGLFEVAHGGTIFLDEVAEMSPSMQAGLLRALQEGEIKPVGADYFKKVDVRVISATNKNLDEMVRNAMFREDLFYRLNVFAINLPPLRERMGDIPVLANHFVNKYNKKHNKSIKGINRHAIKALEAYSFSGNVRELENEIERAIAMADNGKLIGPSHLTDKIRKNSENIHSRPKTQGTLKQMVETLEKSVLLETLKTHKGNRTRTAKTLGLSRFGLSKKMQRYNI